MTIEDTDHLVAAMMKSMNPLVVAVGNLATIMEAFAGRQEELLKRVKVQEVNAELLAACKVTVASCSCKDGKCVHVQKGYPPRDAGDCTRCTASRKAIVSADGVAS
jgi:hypothetical protein